MHMYIYIYIYRERLIELHEYVMIIEYMNMINHYNS